MVRASKSNLSLFRICTLVSDFEMVSFFNLIRIPRLKHPWVGSRINN